MSVMAVVVTYHPDKQILKRLIKLLCYQVDMVLVVDNTPKVDDSVFISLNDKNITNSNLFIVRLGENFGIATAINIGINVALKEHYTHILLSDQDSIPSEGMISALLKAESEILATGIKVGAVGPVYLDTVTGLRFPFQVQEPKHLFYSRKHANNETPNIFTISLITSGTLINTEALQIIGGMREDFFIDHVDVEWCHRAIAKGYAIIGTAYTQMHHHMGEQCLKFWYFGWHTTNGYGPIRLYYRFRNFTYLLRLSYIPIFWKIRASWFWLGIFYAHLFFAPSGIRNLKAMLIGILHGLIGKMGKQDLKIL